MIFNEIVFLPNPCVTIFSATYASMTIIRLFVEIVHFVVFHFVSHCALTFSTKTVRTLGGDFVIGYYFPIEVQL